jgi:hypothetical protein
MDKELIAMCDTPEIQGKWEPKEGDRFFVEYEGDTWHIGGARVPMKGSHGEWDTCDVGCGCCAEGIDGRYIWLPRLEDVLGWLDNEGWKLSSENIGDGPSMWVSVDAPKPEGIKYDSCSWGAGVFYDGETYIQATIKAFMGIEHNKQWTGERWV